MLFLPYLSSPAHPGAATSPLLLTNPGPEPGREPLRHLVMGSPKGVQSTIHQLHALRYADQLHWSKLLTIPESGIIITPQQGEVFSYLLRYRPLE